VHIRTISFVNASKEKMTPGSGARRHRCLRFPNEAHNETMILKIFADAWQVAHNGNPVAAKLLSVADTRKH
jgi:hypothetical protein